MKTTTTALLVGLALASAGALTFVARADAPATSGDRPEPRSAPTPSATTAASGKAPGDTLPPSLATQTIPGERSDVPSNDAWKGATLVEPTRRSILASSCRVYLLREWVKVHCPFPVAGIRQHTGKTRDVQIWVTPKRIDDAGSFFNPPHGGQVVFPLVAGEARMFQFFELDSEGYSSMPIPTDSIIVDAFWIEGRPHPELVLR